MEWKLPPKIKILEALGAVADERVSLAADLTSAHVRSSTGNKSYIVTYDKKQNAIVANDNASYYVGYLGYPAIAFLFIIGVLQYSKKVSSALKGIPWKEVNVKFKNNYDETEQFAKTWAAKRRVSAQILDEEMARISEELAELHLKKLGARTKPPEGY